MPVADRVDSVSMDPDNPSVPALPGALTAGPTLRTLRGRADFLAKKLDSPNVGPNEKSFVREELAAILEAIEAVAWIRSVWMERARLKSIRAGRNRKNYRVLRPDPSRP